MDFVANVPRVIRRAGGTHRIFQIRFLWHCTLSYRVTLRQESLRGTLNKIKRILKRFYFKRKEGEELKIYTSWLDVVPQACNLSYLGGRDLADHYSKPTCAKSSWDPITANGWVWCRVSVIPATQGSTSRLAQV
jgi:hypothetical protein